MEQEAFAASSVLNTHGHGLQGHDPVEKLLPRKYKQYHAGSRHLQQVVAKAAGAAQDGSMHSSLLNLDRMEQGACNISILVSTQAGTSQSHGHMQQYRLYRMGRRYLQQVIAGAAGAAQDGSMHSGARCCHAASVKLPNAGSHGSCTANSFSAGALTLTSSWQGERRGRCHDVRPMYRIRASRSQQVRNSSSTLTL